MADKFTEVTTQSWGSRILESIKSVVVGAVLFLVAFPVMWCNEGRAVTTARSLAEGAGAVVSIAADRVDPANDKKLVHLTGRAETTETLTDPDFGISAAAIKLVRKTEMYQWQEESKSETKEKLGGGKETTTTYEYKKAWSDDAIDSSSFKHPEGHANPGALPWPSRTFTAGKVTLGAFVLSEDLVARIERSEDLRVDAAAAELLPEGSGVRPEGGGYYRGQNPAAPEIGDVRVTFQVVKPLDISVIARQFGSTFEPYQAKAGDALLLLQEGTVSAEAMFKAAEQENNILTWVLRLVGFVLMFMGLMMVLRPISVVGAVVPILGQVLGAGLGLVCLLVTVILSLVTIGAAWIFYRPLLGIGLLAVAAGALFLLRRYGRKAGPPPLPTAA